MQNLSYNHDKMCVVEYSKYQIFRNQWHDPGNFSGFFRWSGSDPFRSVYTVMPSGGKTGRDPAPSPDERA